MKLFTHEQLNREIANLREPEPGKSLSLMELTEENVMTDEWIFHLVHYVWVPRHDYLTDANAMLELLKDKSEGYRGNVIHGYSLSDVKNGIRGSFCTIYATKSFLSDTLPIMAATKKENCEVLVVVMAYYQFKTGEVVELEENEKE